MAFFQQFNQPVDFVTLWRKVQLAGVKGTGTEKNNSIYDQLKSLDDKIAALKRTYEAEKTRYWNQFNTMEQMISNMNAQSSYLAQMMTGG